MRQALAAAGLGPGGKTQIPAICRDTRSKILWRRWKSRFLRVRRAELARTPEHVPGADLGGHLWRVGRLDQAQAAACALPSGTSRSCCRRSLPWSASRGVRWRDEFAKDMREGILEFGGVKEGEPKLESLSRKVKYHADELR